jgi:anti-sigma B factor antagonist
VRTGEIALERTDGGLAVLTMRGEHDLNTAADLRSHLDPILGEGEAVVIDLSPATFVDSSILGVILDARRRASEAGSGFAVMHADGADAVGRVLEITGLRDELPVHTSREQALNEAGSSGKAGA